jgi:cytochrome c-type biogenesis protein CcmH/NrfG
MLLASAYKGLGRVQEANQMLRHAEQMKPENKRY